MAKSLLGKIPPSTDIAVGQSVRTSNISATVGSDVSLNCDFLPTRAKITQVNWDTCTGGDIAFQVPGEGHVVKGLEAKFTLADRYGIKVLNVNENDTGTYCCTYNTFPDGKMSGKIFLIVTDHSNWTYASYVLGSLIVSGVLLLIGALAIIIHHKKKSNRIKNNPTQNASSQNPDSNRTPNQVHITPSAEEERATVEYFNVILHQSPKR
ncbi:hypothetical protein GDO86_002623 [Hymenochirus boettgeri]|uniref:Ig-like domain-containing protein n=1 Tax=Hymenochirus boettgeri TaxID=247094 RepID=A0A8T2K363_9PIPI|nr:hypothetical protein GDO86_002623 [Hymenochirus boettgeri]